MSPRAMFVAGTLVCILLLSYPFGAYAEETNLTLGAVVAMGNADLVNESGTKIMHIHGPSVGWDSLMPDGRHFDERAIAYVDRVVIDAHQNGLKVLFRLRSGGGGEWSFTALDDEEDFPVDLTDYRADGPTRGYKNGEYLGSKLSGFAGAASNYPPKVFTDDRPGNTSPWYDFCFAIASRYNGKTPDPRRPGKYLPKIDYFSTEGEMDTTRFWYGTIDEYYGMKIRSGATIGLLPTIYRAVKAANPEAQVIDGGFVCYHIGWYMVYQMAEQKRAVDKDVLEYNNRYFKYAPVHMFAMPEHLRSFLESPFIKRSRKFIDRCFESDAFWDIFSFHSYEDYLMHDTIRFLKEKMDDHGVDKPIHAKEIGVSNDFVFMPQTEKQLAARLMKKFVSSFAEGINICSVAPFVALPAFEGKAFSGLYRTELNLYRTFNPSTTIPELQHKFGTPMLRSYNLLSEHLASCRPERYVENGEAAIYIFRDPLQDKVVVIGWTEDPADQLDPLDYLPPGDFRMLSLQDPEGNVLPSTMPDRLVEEPFLLVLLQPMPNQDPVQGIRPPADKTDDLVVGHEQMGCSSTYSEGRHASWSDILNLLWLFVPAVSILMHLRGSRDRRSRLRRGSLE